MSVNFARSTVAVPPSPASSGTSIGLPVGHGVRFIAGPAFLSPPNVDSTPLNAEVVTVSAVVGDVLTVVRGAEGSTARDIGSGWSIGQGLTAAQYDALGALVATKANASATTAALALKLGTLSEYYHDFAGKADGPAPTVLDSGQVSRVDCVDPLLAQTVVSGVLTHDPTSAGGGAAASYFSAPTAAPVRELGCELVFNAVSATSEQIALTNWTAQIALPPSQAIAPGIHCVVGPSAYTFGIWTGTTDSIQHTHTYATPLTVGQFYTINITLDLESGVAYILGPDGVTETVTDQPNVWSVSTAYALGARVYANGNSYVVTTAGTSAATGGGPATTGTGISDGTVTWDYLQAGKHSRITQYQGQFPTWEAFAATGSKIPAGIRRLWASTGSRPAAGRPAATITDTAKTVANRQNLTVAQSNITSAWSVSTFYPTGATRSANGNSYRAVTGGTSAVSGYGPVGTGSSISDGTVTWEHIQGGNIAAWEASTAYAVSDYVCNVGRIYRCSVAGTSAASGGPTVGAGTTVDGGATWAWVASSGSIVPITTTPKVIDKIRFTVPASRRIWVDTAQYFEFSASTDLFLQLGIEGNPTFGFGNTVHKASSGGGLKFLKGVIDLSAFARGATAFHVTIHAYVSVANSAVCIQDNANAKRAAMLVIPLPEVP